MVYSFDIRHTWLNKHLLYIEFLQMKHFISFNTTFTTIYCLRLLFSNSLHPLSALGSTLYWVTPEKCNNWRWKIIMIINKTMINKKKHNNDNCHNNDNNNNYRVFWKHCLIGRLRNLKFLWSRGYCCNYSSSSTHVHLINYLTFIFWNLSRINDLLSFTTTIS